MLSIPFDYIIPNHLVVHTIYGSFNKTPGSILNSLEFYIEDVSLTEVNLYSREKIRNLIIDNYVKIQSADKNLILDILNNIEK